MSLTATDLNAYAKEIYADKPINLIPEELHLVKDYTWREAASTGDKFIQPVKLSHESGFTYSIDDNSAFDLENAVPAIFKEAQVDGSSIVLSSLLSMVQLAKLDKSVKGFMKAPATLLEDMNQAIWKRLEIAGFYGRSSTGLATIHSNTQVGGDVYDIVITAATTAPGIWAGAEGSYVDVIYNDGGTLKQRTSHPVLISRVSLGATNTLRVTYNASESAEASVVAGDFLVWNGAMGQVAATAACIPTEPCGMDKIITNTGSLFNIDASVYSLWAGNSFNVNGGLTYQKLLQAADYGVGKGLSGDLNVYIPSKAFQQLASVESAFRRYNEAPNKATNGAQSLEFFYQAGKMTIKPSIHVKPQEAFMVPKVGGHRIGASDVTFKLPGYNDDMFIQLPTNAGVALRAFSHQGWFFEAPAKMVKLYGITY